MSLKRKDATFHALAFMTKAEQIRLGRNLEPSVLHL